MGNGRSRFVKKKAANKKLQANSAPVIPKIEVNNPFATSGDDFEGDVLRIPFAVTVCQNAELPFGTELEQAMLFLKTYSTSETQIPVKHEWANNLARNQFAEMSFRLWNVLWQPLNIEELGIYESMEKNIIEVLEYRDIDDHSNLRSHFTILTAFLNLIWNSSDVSKEFCVCLCDPRNPVFGQLISLLNDSMFTVNQIDESQDKTYVTTACLGIVHNCLRHCRSKTKQLCRDYNGLKTCIRLIDSLQDRISTQSILIVAYVVNDNEVEILDSIETDEIRQISKLLGDAVVDPDHMARGFSAEEIMDGMNHMLISDEIKAKLLSFNIDDYYRNVLVSHQSDIELARAVRGLWLMSFRKNHETVSSLYDCVEVLQELVQSSDDPALVNSAKGTLWNIEQHHIPKEINRNADRNDTFRAPKPDAFQDRVIVSYDVENYYQAQELRSELEKRNFEVWMDDGRTVEEEREKSVFETLDDLADGALVAIICFTDEYKDSPNCRSEAEILYRNGVPLIPVCTEPGYEASGWLGLIFGMQSYIDYFDKADGSAVIDQVLQRIDRVRYEIEEERRKEDAESIEIIQLETPTQLRDPSPEPVAKPKKKKLKEPKARRVRRICHDPTHNHDREPEKPTLKHRSKSLNKPGSSESNKSNKSVKSTKAKGSRNSKAKRS